MWHKSLQNEVVENYLNASVQNESMKPGKVERYILDKIENEGAILLALIDPDKTPFEKGAKIAEACCEAGSDVILVGGSIGAQGLILDRTTKMIREKVNVPIVLFPGNVGTITPYADAIYFMTLLNSRDVYWVSTVHIQGAPIVKRIGIEAIPSAYIVLEPGRAAGWIGNVNLIPRDRADLAAATALAGEYMGARLVITDSGSGAPDPAPPQLIAAVKSQLSVPYFYAGGCRTTQHARDIIKAGADGIQIGTAFEIDDGYEKVKQKVSEMVKTIKETAQERARKREKEEKHRFLPMVRVPRISWRWPKIRKKKNRNSQPLNKESSKQKVR